jgi:hypothetical protein
MQEHGINPSEYVREHLSQDIIKQGLQKEYNIKE